MSRRLLDGIAREIPHLRRYARALTRDPDDADDLVQDTLERAIARLDQFRPGTDLRSWMFTIMHNLFIDGRRRQRRRGETVEIEEWMADAAAPPAQLDAVAVRQVLEQMEELSPHEREVLEKVAVQGMKYEDAADELGVAVGTVKSRLFRARENLKRLGAAA